MTQDPLTRDEIIRNLAQLAAARQLDADVVLPALSSLAGPGNPGETGAEILAALETSQSEPVRRLVESLKSARRQSVIDYHELRRSGRTAPRPALLPCELPLDAPLGWQTCDRPLQAMEQSLTCLRDWLFLEPYREKLGGISARVLSAYQEAVAVAHQAPDAWRAWPIARLARELAPLADTVDVRDCLGRLAGDEERAAVQAAEAVAHRPALTLDLRGEFGDTVLLDEIARRFSAAAGREARRQLLNLLLAWPNDLAAPYLLRLVQEPWAREHADLALILRFGAAKEKDWSDWAAWLKQHESLVAGLRDRIEASAAWPSPELLIVWCAGRRPDLVAPLGAWCAAKARSVRAEDFVARWQVQLAPAERAVILPPGVGVTSEMYDRSIPAATAEPVTAPAPQSTPVRPASATIKFTPAPPSRLERLWSEHIQPFFLANWYILAGILMVVVGSSLLAYYTWDKHWLLRYTIMPLLLAGFTVALARTGAWIERRDVELKAMAAMLRGAAIGLLPINFMAVALLAVDPAVPRKPAIVPVMALLYLHVFGRGLRRWCAAVHASLGTLLGATLLALDALVLLVPLSLLTPVPLTAGFYAGFLLLAGATIRFNNRVLTREVAQEERVPWFFGVTLVLTFVQVFAWVHGLLRAWPAAAPYALMVIMTGGLLLHTERRALALQHETRLHRSESFLGFALIILGLLMAAGDAWLRIAALLLAGALWLWQALVRRQALHDWIALVLLLLGGAAVGLLDGFPVSWLPVLGIGLGLAMLVLAHVSRRICEPVLGATADEAGVTTFILSTVVAVLAQWHCQSEPLVTAGLLAVIAGLVMLQAVIACRGRWLLVAMIILALDLPYLGCVDLAGHTLYGNCLVFGLAALSLLWLLVNRVTAQPLVRRMRSSVLWIYAALALAAMVVRVVVERDPAEAMSSLRIALDLAGPILMTAALVGAAWHSRSLVPGFIAVLIAAVLFPGMKADFTTLFPALKAHCDVAWGTGLGSALSALGLMLAMFALRAWPRLASLGDGDRLFGAHAFPLCRRDYTLFTWPLGTAVLFLASKVLAWNVPCNLTIEGLAFKSSCALGLVAILLTLAGIYLRERSGARIATYFSWVLLFVAIVAGYWRVAENPVWHAPVLGCGVLLQVFYWIYRYALEARLSWAQAQLTRPTLALLSLGSFLFAALAILVMFTDARPEEFAWLLLFLAGQMIWHALATRLAGFGASLFLMAWTALLSVTAPGSAPLLARLGWQQSLMPTLWFLLAIELTALALEWLPIAYERGRALLSPFRVASALIVTATAFLGFLVTLQVCLLGPEQLVLLVVVLLLTGRAHGCGPCVLLACLLAALLVQYQELLALATYGERVLLVIVPWRWAAFALALACAAASGSWLRERVPVFFVGAAPLRCFSLTVRPWLETPAILFACLAVNYHLLSDSYRVAPVQLWAPYLAALTVAVVAVVARDRAPFNALAAAFFALANIHLVRVFAGAWLIAQGLSDNHLTGLGLALTLLAGTLARLLARREAVTVFVNRASLVFALVILGVLSANYLAAPNLEAITPFRFAVTGVMALLAGLYFRRAGRTPGAGEEPWVEWSIGCYHFGVTVALWCAALMLPPLRTPATALFALGLPVLWFYGCAEFQSRLGRDGVRQYRHSAATISFIILALYVFRGAFQLMLFPDQPITTDAYHDGAPLIVALAVIMLRLRGLGGTAWLAFYGGLAMITGSYFLLTAAPGLSPFTHPVPAAWCAVGLAHFWTLVTATRSPLRTAAMRLAQLDDEQWHRLRRPWGHFMLAALHVCALNGMLRCGADTRAVAPLIVGASSLCFHFGVIRSMGWYHVLGGLELLAALHMDFLVPSHLPRGEIVWVLLGLWVLVLVAHRLAARRFAVAEISTALALLVFAHVLYHGPADATGLAAFALGALLAALTPVETRSAPGLLDRLAAALLLAVPAWLAFFGQGYVGSVAEYISSWRLLVTCGVLFLTGAGAAHFAHRLYASYAAWPRPHPRLFDRTLEWTGEHGGGLNSVTLAVSFAGALLVQLAHYGAAFAARELALLLLLFAVQAVAWFVEGRRRGSVLPYVCLQVAAFAFFAVVRRQLILTTSFWAYEFDIWASLAVSFLLAGLKDLFESEPQEERVAFTASLWLLPVVAITWTLVHHLGSNVALLVVGLHGLMFAWLGRNERRSPYNFVAVLVFVSFVLIAFWDKLGLRALHAYVIPTGVGVLVLLQLFKETIPLAARNQIRLVTALAMLGSVGYYALIDDSYPVVYNLTLILLALFAMGLGGFLRVRLYLVLGFAGLVVDLASILYKGTMLMERNARMTTVGSLVLGLGVALVAGAVFYRTHQEEIGARLRSWQERLAGWE